MPQMVFAGPDGVPSCVPTRESPLQSPASDTRFRSLFDKHEAAMREYCSRRLGVHEANDAVAEVFLVAWRKIDTLPEPDEQLMWLYGVARNVVRNATRSSRRSRRLAARAETVSSNPGAGPEEQVVRRFEDQLVLRAMATLKPDDQEILRLRTWEDLSRTELASVFGISPAAADMRLNRAQQRMAKALRAVGYQRGATPSGKGQGDTS